MSKFFIRRPIVAIVIAIVTVILGVVSLVSLPTSQYPDIVPPEILVTATYPGADSKTVSQSVSTPIEQQMNGVDNMIYMDSVSANNGVVQLFVDFDVKTDPNIDQVLAQLRVDQAQSQLPAQVTTAGLTVQKALTSPLMLVAINSPGGKLGQEFLTNYAIINLQDQLARVKGVSRVQVFGGQYAMRIWVHPDQMAKLGITAPEVIQAIQTQNNVNPAGQIGAEPIAEGQKFTYTVRTQGRLVKAEEFGEIVIRSNPDGSIVRLRDIARVELGQQAYTISARYNQAPSGVMAIYQLPGSNAVQTAAAVNARMKELVGDLSRRHHLRRTPRHHQGRHRRYPRDRAHAAGSSRPGRHCRLHLPPGVARHADSVAGRSRLAHRNLHHLSRAGLLHQHPFALRPGAGHRPGRR